MHTWMKELNRENDQVHRSTTDWQLSDGRYDPWASWNHQSVQIYRRMDQRQMGCGSACFALHHNGYWLPASQFTVATRVSTGTNRTDRGLRHFLHLAGQHLLLVDGQGVNPPPTESVEV